MKNDPKTRDIPIIMLTAKGEESDIVTGLELGANLAADHCARRFWGANFSRVGKLPAGLKRGTLNHRGLPGAGE